MSINRRSFLQISASSAALVLAGCGGVGKSKPSAGSSNSGSLSTQGFGKPDDVGQARIDAFKAAYPEVSLHINEGDFDPQQFLSAVASGNPPDLVYLDRNLIGSYAAQGALQPLNDLLGKVGLDLKSYREPATAPCTVNGTVYGIPEFYNTRNILINGRALAETGLQPADLATNDWNRLHDTARRLYRTSSRGISRIGFDPKLPEFLPLWAKANGAELVNDDGSPNLDDPKIVEALEYAHSLIAEQGGWSRFKAFRDTWDVFGSGNELVKDQAGAFPWEGWYVNVLVQASPKLDLQSIHFTDRQGNPISFCDGSAWCVPRGAKSAELAVRWMKTVTATDTWLKAAAARQHTATKNNTMFTGLWIANPEADRQIKASYVKPSNNPGFDAAVSNYYESTEYAFAIKPSKVSSEIKTAWTDAANRVLTGTQAPRQALTQAQREAATAFSSAR